MRNQFCVVAVFGLILSGCSLFHHQRADSEFAALPGENPLATTVAPANNVIVTPAPTVAGKVLKVNETAHFVVLGFPVGKMPQLNAIMGIYRHGIKIGEVKLTGPQSDENIVAEIVSGDPIENDEARVQ